MRRANLPRVLCIGCSSMVFERLHQCLKYGDLTVVSAITSEQAVANCVANMISLAIIDCDSMPDRQWSVAQSLKMVRPALPVILLEKDEKHLKMPAGIDAVVSLSTMEKDLPNKVRELLKH
jgi:DNA-binding NarL/FixJ family response regulator